MENKQWLIFELKKRYARFKQAGSMPDRIRPSGRPLRNPHQVMLKTLNAIQNSPIGKQKLLPLGQSLLHHLADWRTALRSNAALLAKRDEATARLKKLVFSAADLKQRIFLEQQRIRSKQQLHTLLRQDLGEFNGLVCQLQAEYKRLGELTLTRVEGIDPHSSGLEFQQQAEAEAEITKLAEGVETRVQQLMKQLKSADLLTVAIKSLNFCNNLRLIFRNLERKLFARESLLSQLFMQQMFSQANLEVSLYQTVKGLTAFSHGLTRQAQVLFAVSVLFKPMLSQIKQKVLDNQNSLVHTMLKRGYQPYDLTLPCTLQSKIDQFQRMICLTNPIYFQNIYFKKVQKRLVQALELRKECRNSTRRMKKMESLMKGNAQVSAIARQVIKFKEEYQGRRDKDQQSLKQLGQQLVPMQEAVGQLVRRIRQIQELEKVVKAGLLTQFSRQARNQAEKCLAAARALLESVLQKYRQIEDRESRGSGQKVKAVQDSISAASKFLQQFRTELACSLDQQALQSGFEQIERNLISVKKSQAFTHELRGKGQEVAEYEERLLDLMVNLELLTCMFQNSQHYSLQRIEDLLSGITFSSEGLASLNKFKANLVLILSSFREGQDYQTQRKHKSIVAAFVKRSQIIRLVQGLFQDLSNALARLLDLSAGVSPESKLVISEQMPKRLLAQLACLNELHGLAKQIQDFIDIPPQQRAQMQSSIEDFNLRAANFVGFTVESAKDAAAFVQLYYKVLSRTQSLGSNLISLAKSHRKAEFSGLKEEANNIEQTLKEAIRKSSGLVLFRVPQNKSRVDQLRKTAEQLATACSGTTDPASFTSKLGLALAKYL